MCMLYIYSTCLYISYNIRYNIEWVIVVVDIQLPDRVVNYIKVMMFKIMIVNGDNTSINNLSIMFAVLLPN